MTVCRLTDLSSIFTYQGEETCAADGMCQVKCPVKINTGELIKHIRHENLGDQTRAQKAAMVRPCPPGTAGICAQWSEAVYAAVCTHMQQEGSSVSCAAGRQDPSGTARVYSQWCKVLQSSVLLCADTLH